MLVMSISQKPRGEQKPGPKPCNHAGHLEAAGPEHGGSDQGGNDKSRLRKPPAQEIAAHVVGNAYAKFLPI